MNNNKYNQEQYDKNASAYDKKFGFSNYSHTHVENPAMLKRLGDIKGKDILCIGCGTGDEANLLQKKGANVVGFDMSNELISIAKDRYPNIEFYVGTIEDFSLDREFDIAYSSFVMHYFSSWKDILLQISKLLKSNGKFIFSIPHPMTICKGRKKISGREYKILGHSRNENDRMDFEVYGDYLNTREVDLNFSKEFNPKIIHRSFSNQIRDILNSEFEILDVLEPQPIDSTAEDYPDEYEVHMKMPLVFIYYLQKKS